MDKRNCPRVKRHYVRPRWHLSLSRENKEDNGYENKEYGVGISQNFHFGKGVIKREYFEQKKDYFFLRGGFPEGKKLDLKKLNFQRLIWWFREINGELETQSRNGGKM